MCFFGGLIIIILTLTQLCLKMVLTSTGHQMIGKMIIVSVSESPLGFFLFFSAAFSEKPSPPSPTTYPLSEVHQLAERPRIHLFAGQPHEVSLSEMPKVARIIGFTAGLSNKHRDLAWFNPEKWWYNMKLYDRMGYYDMMEVTWTNVETSCLMKIGWFPIIPYRPQNATLVRLIGNGRITV